MARTLLAASLTGLLGLLGYIHPAYADGPERYANYSPDPSGAEHRVEIDANTISDADILALAKAASAQTLHIRISGICRGICSRVLIPTASRVTFATDSFAVLTDSSTPDALSVFRSHFGTRMTAATQSRRVSISSQDRQNFFDDYRSSRASSLQNDLSLLEHTLIDPSHLFLHRIERDRMRHLHTAPCTVGENYGVVLTARYFEYIRKRVSGNMPDTMTFKRVAELAQQELGPISLTYAFGSNLISHETLGKKALSRCNVEAF